MNTINNISDKNGFVGTGRNWNADLTENTIRIYGTESHLTGWDGGHKTETYSFDKTYKIGDTVRIEWGFDGQIVKITKSQVHILGNDYYHTQKRISLFTFITYNVM